MKPRLIIGLVALALAACTQPTPTPTPKPAPTGIIVPPSAATPIPAITSTLPVEVTPLTGPWWLDLAFVFTGGEYIDEIAFSTIISFQIDRSGRFEGRGEVSVEPDAPGCVADVVEGENFTIDMRGHIEANQEGEPVFVFELTPEDSMLLQDYTVMCPPENEVKAFQSQLLWHALRLTGLQTLRIPAETGPHPHPTRNITSPSQRQLNYQMDLTAYLGR